MAETLLTARHLVAHAAASPESPGRVLVRDGVVVATGAAAESAAAEALDLGDTVLLPGFVNAHQHGRGLPQGLLGFPDDALEAWINRRRGRGSPEAFPLVRLAALRMLANGVTACLHANWSYGGDQQEEVAATLRAYAAAGIRARVMIGVADRGALLYPGFDEAAFRARLDPDARAIAEGVRRHPFPQTAAQAADIFDALARDFAGHPRVAPGFGPTGPQWVSDGLFRDVAAAAERDAVLHFHLLESPAQAKACARLHPEGTARRLAALGALGPRSSAAHGVFVTDDDLAVLAETGTGLVANPGSNLRLGNVLPRYDAWRRAGVAMALGGDDTELNDDRDPWGELRLVGAVARMDPAAQLAMATEGGARVLGLEGRVGRIAPGYAADIVALDPAPALAPWADPDVALPAALVARASGREVRMTMVGGRVLWRDGRFTDLDLAGCEAAAVATAAASRRHPSRDPAVVERLGRALLELYAD